ncbi:RICIN domain-containing protein [Kitasatospora sp. NPDC057512]|uniref:RICIN domain-containing protein n=1 Tax=Kitasatospora sp. NPDC057512 TaxID=3346154 RepID=UPI0036BEE623
MKSVARLAGTVGASLALLLGSAGNSHAVTGSAVTFHNVNSNLCLSVPAASTGFEYLNQFNCGGYPDQYWDILEGAVWKGATYYKIVNRNSGLCLSVDKASKADLARVTQYPCGTPLYPDQYWAFGDSMYGGRQLVNWNSGRCLAIEGGSFDWTAPAIQYTCGTWRDHFWAF